MSFLNKKIFNNDFDVFGLDLSDLSVKVIRLEDDGTSEYVASYSTVMLASGAKTLSVLCLKRKHFFV